MEILSTRFQALALSNRKSFRREGEDEVEVEAELVGGVGENEVEVEAVVVDVV